MVSSSYCFFKLLSVLHSDTSYSRNCKYYHHFHALTKCRVCPFCSSTRCVLLGSYLTGGKWGQASFKGGREYIQTCLWSTATLDCCRKKPACVAGPAEWHREFPIANGNRQSPIDIVPSQAQHDPALKPLSLQYDPKTAIDILNNGHSFQVDFADGTDTSSELQKSCLCYFKKLL